MSVLDDYPRPFACQFKGSRLADALLRLCGWRLRFEGLPARQGVLVIYPHTSNWDLVVMIVAKWASGVDVQFWSKESLFRVPVLGRWLRWVGAVPVRRDSAAGATAQAVALMEQARKDDRHFWLCLTPEGTRRRTEGWRSGFYRTALQAGAPLGLVRLDYGRREVTVRDFLRLSGDPQRDMQRIRAVYEGVQGRWPAQASPVRLLRSEPPAATMAP